MRWKGGGGKSVETTGQDRVNMSIVNYSLQSCKTAAIGLESDEEKGGAEDSASFLTENGIFPSTSRSLCSLCQG